MESRTFRQPSCLTVIFAFPGVVGVGISGISLYHLVTGIPLWQATSKFTSGLSIATSSDLWFGVIGGLPLILLSVMGLLHAFNTAVTIDDQGLRATDHFRRVTFRAKWCEITAVEHEQRGSTTIYKVTGNGKFMQFDNTLTGADDLIKVIKARSKKPSDT